MSYLKSITNDEINNLPLGQFNGTIKLIDSFKKFKSIKSDLKKYTIFGFDTETKPAFKKGVINAVSLLQLSVSEVCYVFRLNKIGLPKELINIFKNKEIIKIGLAIKDDINDLQKIAPFNPKGFIDLKTISLKHEIEVLSLKKLSAIILSIRISKAKQLSNWELEELSDSQLMYAATDAWVCFEMFKKLNKTI